MNSLLQNAVDELASLPMLGRKSAMRLALHLLRKSPQDVDRFVASISSLRHNIRYCNMCHNISEQQTCDICSNPLRDKSTLCVVESFEDVIALESTGQYKGLYHVLGGLVSPLDGIGISDIEIPSLIERAEKEDLREIILAINPTMEGDTTCYVITRALDKTGKQIYFSTLARGISLNDELQYTDQATLSRSLLNRIPFNKP